MREVGGDEVQLTSDGGMLNNATQLATFLGQVHVTLMDGYILETDTLVADLDGSVATSPDPVRLTGPRLSLTAGSLEVTSRAEAQPLVVFKDGVRLIYTPQSE